MTDPETNEPGTSESAAKTGNSFFKQRGPFILVGVFAVLAAGFVAFGYFTSDEEMILEAPTTTAVESTESPTSGIAYPLSFSEATAQGTVDAIEWGDTCDTETGRLAVPDFFAPECMAPFEGDNGGATSTGVGRDTIKVVFYQVVDNDPTRAYLFDTVSIDDTGEQQVATITDYLEYYRDYYELYGRSIELVTYQTKAAANDDAAARADAQRIADQIRPFAVIGGPALTNAFAEEIAARKIICIDCGAGSTQWFKDRDPFLWSTDASGSQKQIHLAEFARKQLVNKPASYTTGDLSKTNRVFGHVYLDRGPESALLADQMIGRFESAGSRPVESIPYTIEPDKMAEKATEIITKLKTAGVTTVILSTDPVTTIQLTMQASLQKYNPEWLVGVAPLVDSTIYGRFYNSKQWIHAYGITTRAVPTIAGAGNFKTLYEWFMGRSPFADETIEMIMPPFAFLMEAIHRAGPNLTPESFAASLRSVSTKPATTQPFYRWGDNSIWEDGDFSGIEDATLFWWDPTVFGLDEAGRPSQGMMRFADAGKRYLLGGWPEQERAFVVDGSLSILETLPSGEEVPSYPSPTEGEAATPSSTSTPPPEEPDESGLPGAEDSSSTSSGLPAD